MYYYTRGKTMSKTFKVVCINGASNTFLNLGQIFNARTGCEKTRTGCYGISTLGGNENYSHLKQSFLRLPTEPKAPRDMTMEEWLAINTVRSVDHTKVEYFHDKWITCVSATPNHKLATTKIRIKPDNPHGEAIVRIESEMRKLADELAELKQE